MSILSKMMRIAGRGDDGTAKAVATTNDGVLKTQLTGNNVEEVLAENLTLAPGEAQLYEIDMENFSSYRLVITPNDNASEDAIILVRAMTDLGSNPEIMSHNVPIIETRGGRRVNVGYTSINTSATRNSIWSKPQMPLRKNQKIRVVHASQSTVATANFKVVVLKYANSFADANPTGSIVGRQYTSTIPVSSVFPPHDDQDNLTYDFPVAIDYVEWQCDHSNLVRLYMEVKINGTWVPLTRYNPRPGDGSTHYHTPSSIQSAKSGLWDILEFDSESTPNYYKFCLKRPIPIIAPEGFRIYLENSSAQSERAGGIIVMGRRLS